MYGPKNEHPLDVLFHNFVNTQAFKNHSTGGDCVLIKLLEKMSRRCSFFAVFSSYLAGILNVLFSLSIHLNIKVSTRGQG